MNDEINKRKMSNVVWLAYIGIMLTYLLFINLQTPLIGEDYAFFSSTTNKINLIKEIAQGVIYRFYPDNNTFNLRLGDMLSFLWLNLGKFFGIGKILFSILNSVVTILFFVLIFYWSNCRLPNIDSIKDLVIFSTIPVLFLICSFSIGEVFFWCGGATNYLWAGTILLGTAIPYRKYLHDGKYKIKNKLIFCYIILSYFAAFTNENTVPIIILLGSFLLLRDFVKKGIGSIPNWLFLSVLSMGIGYSVLIFSPNTKRRTMVYRNMFNLPENMSLDEIINNAKRVIHSFIDSNYRFIVLFFICLIMLLIIFINQQMKTKQHFSRQIFFLFYENTFLLLISSISVVALFFAPYTEIRSFLFVQIFVIVFIIQINDVALSTFPDNKYKYLPNFCFCLLSLVFIYRLSFWTLDYAKFDRARSESVRKQISNGQLPIIAKKYFIERNKYLNTREIWTQDATYGGSYFYAKYHGASNIFWRTTSFEEETMELKHISNILIPQNVSELQTYDVSSINYSNGKLILSCGNIDPQIYFPLIEPINKISDTYYVDISCKNSMSGMFQVFYDFGKGLNEENSCRIDIVEMKEMAKIRVPIVGWQKGETLYMLRIDPPNGTEFWLENLVIVEKGDN